MEEEQKMKKTKKRPEKKRGRGGGKAGGNIERNKITDTSRLCVFSPLKPLLEINVSSTFLVNTNSYKLLHFIINLKSHLLSQT